jgi:phosphoribosylformylglycinamidine synthase
MILFFESKTTSIIAVGTVKKLLKKDTEKLIWLFNKATLRKEAEIESPYVGPRKEMITPWSRDYAEYGD